MTAMVRWTITLPITASILVGLAGAAGAQKLKTVERIVAVVNDEIILLSQIDDRLAPLKRQLAQLPDPATRRKRRAELKRQAVDHMVDERLIVQHARKLKLEVKDSELDAAVADVMRKNNLTREQLEQALAREGKSLRAYKETILRPQLLRLKVLNVTVRSRVSVGKEEIRARYEKNLRALGVQTKVRARHIFFAIQDGADSKQVDARQAAARALLAQIRKGKKFGEMAKQHSDDSVTRNEGGDLGYFGRGTLPANVEDVVFTMKKGEVRGPLRTARGFHLIQVTDRRESSARSFDEVKRELKQQIYGEKLEKSTQAWLREIRKRSHIDLRL